MLTALVLLDLSKAFDSINHNILLQKLECISASQSSLRWFSSYLSGRSQVLRIVLLYLLLTSPTAYYKEQYFHPYSSACT